MAVFSLQVPLAQREQPSTLPYDVSRFQAAQPRHGHLEVIYRHAQLFFLKRAGRQSPG